MSNATNPSAGTPRVALVSLGCAKNLVDAEQMLGALCADGYEVTLAVEQAEVVVVNTCGFLGSAREEAVREIRKASRQKTQGRCEVLVVSGCYAQIAPDAVREKCPEVDLVVGVSEFARLPELVREVRGDRALRPTAVSLPDLPYQEYLPRRRATPPWTAYQKIAEGCDCRCTFCTIPSIRGSFRSRPLEAVVDEARRLVDDGVRELVLIAEDLTHYGQDRAGRRQLAELLRRLGAIDELHWVRLLYCYPTKVDDELIGAMAEVDKVAKYVDMPLQHADDGILKAMGRGGRQAGYLRLLDKLRAAMPDVCVRSTFIVGFPGERREEFERLGQFLEAAELDRVGFFPYSREPGTPAAELGGQVSSKVAAARVAELAQRQAAISLRRNQRWVGRELTVLVEQADGGRLSGRSFRDAPEIDGMVQFDGTARPGELVTALITEAGVHDLLGRQTSG